MAKAAAGTPKAVANAAKAKGLGRLRWYCQVCQKQCRDDNGFKCHIATEAHLRQMLVVGESAGQYIDDYSKEFMDEFIVLLSRRYNTKRIRANQVYQEYIQDKNHIHMNATKWTSLTEFVKYLGKEGIVRVDETEKGFFISWVDNSPGALARQDAIAKKERQDTDDEQRQRKLLAEQIARAKESEASSSSGPSDGPSAAQGLLRPATEDGSKVKLSFSFGLKPKDLSPPSTTPADPSSSATSAINDPSFSSSTSDPSSSSATTTTAAITTLPAPSAPAAPPAKFSFQNPLKRSAPPTSSNVFKSAKSPSSSTASSSSSSRPSGAKLSVAEQLMKEDEERKKRGGGRGGYDGQGPRRVKPY